MVHAGVLTSPYLKPHFSALKAYRITPGIGHNVAQKVPDAFVQIILELM